MRIVYTLVLIVTVILNSIAEYNNNNTCITLSRLKLVTRLINAKCNNFF